MGKPVDFGLTALEALRSEKDPFARACTLAKCTGYASWLLLDMVQWLHAQGVLSVNDAAMAAISRTSPRLWLLGIAASLVLNLHRVQQCTLHRRRLTYAAAADPETDAALRKDLERLGRGVLQDSLDLVIPLASMGYLPLSPGVVGLAGSVTSVLGAVALYPAKEKLE